MEQIFSDMDAVLINPNPSGKGLNEATIEPPLGLAYIAAVLEKNGFLCKIIDANALSLDYQKILEKIPIGTKLVGLYLNSFSYKSCQELIKKIKAERKKSLVILGGPVPSGADSNQLLKEMGCDGLIKGEGEFAVLVIMENIKKNLPPFEGKISGLTYLKANNGLVSNPVERISDLDSLPFPAFHLLPPFGAYKTRSRKSPVAAIITSRGCPFLCTFCSKDIFKKMVTYRSAKNVLEEIDFLVKNYGIRQIDILDDNFALNKARFVEILNGLIERNYDLALNFQSGIRAENVDEAILVKMKKAGVYKLAFGIESADENVLKINKKGLNLEKIEDVVKKAKKMGFVVYGFFIIGLPGETEEAFEKTLAFAKKLDFDVANFCMATPFINTELYEMVKTKGNFLVDTTKNIDVGFYGGKVFFEYGDSKQEDILKRYQKAYKEFYSFKKQLKILLAIRSLSELAWVKNAGLSVLRGIFKKKNF